MTTQNFVEELRPGTSEPCPPQQIIGYLLKSLHFGLRQTMDTALRARGLELSFAHIATLYSLHYEPGSTGAHLARRVMVSPQTMNPVLRKLEAESLIERRPHPDNRRADSWFMTDAGNQQFQEASATVKQVFDRMLSPLDATELERLQDYLGRCVSALANGDSTQATESARS